MEKEYETLWEEEHKTYLKDSKDKKILKRIEENSKLTGITVHIPYKLRGVVINPKGANQETILISAGYVKNYNDRGWIRWIDSNHRFHAFILSTGKIMIHSDLIKNNKHIPSEEGCKEEKVRIKKNFIPVLQEDLNKRVYRKAELVLPLAEQRRLLAGLNKKSADSI